MNEFAIIKQTKELITAYKTLYTQKESQIFEYGVLLKSEPSRVRHFTLSPNNSVLKEMVIAIRKRAAVGHNEWKFNAMVQ